MKTVRKYVLRPSVANEIITTLYHRILFAGIQNDQIVLFIEEWIDSVNKEIKVVCRETDKPINYLSPDEYITTAIFPDIEYHIYKLV